LYAAGAFTFPDGLYLLNKYATIYQEVLTTLDAGAIHVQGVPTIVLEKICKKASVNGLHASIGICTGPADHVITGNEAAVADVRGQIAKDFDVSIADISLEIGLHSSLMQEVADRWAPYLEKVDFKDVALPIISSTQASLLRTGEEIKKHILAHMVSPVKWPLVMDALDQYDILVEVCPGKQLSSLAKEKYPDKIVLSINKRSDVSDLKKIVDNSSQTAEL
jgi:[acyl-carrier-protein] S-malonyltransferase